MTTLGAPIKLHAPFARPAWLADDDHVRPVTDLGECSFIAPAGTLNFSTVKGVILQSDHWAYDPIAKGFEPWAGGESAPVGALYEALLRNGDIIPCDEYTRWNRSKIDHVHFKYDVIGFNRIPQPVAVPIAPPLNDWRIACDLYYAIWTKHYPDAPMHPYASDIQGVLAQIDDVVAKLERVDGVHTNTITKVAGWMNGRGMTPAIALDMIEHFLPTPVDPDLIEAREIAASVYDDNIGKIAFRNPTQSAREIREGKKDDGCEVYATLKAIKRGRVLANGKE